MPASVCPSLAAVRTAAVLAGLLLAGAVSVAGQANTGIFEGVVRDESGGVMPGAAVVATHTESGFTVERVTGSDGRFYMASLPIGEWTLTAELPGFRRVVRTGIFLDLGRTIDLTFQLDLGQITEEVTVTAAAPLLQTTTAEISDVIDTREVEQIPLNGRQFLQLAQPERRGDPPSAAGTGAPCARWSGEPRLCGRAAEHVGLHRRPRPADARASRAGFDSVQSGWHERRRNPRLCCGV